MADDTTPREVGSNAGLGVGGPMLKRFLQRWIKPPFFVCEWKTIGEKSGMPMSGEFACLGATFDEAKDDACRFIEQQLQIGMRALANIRKATWRERWRPLTQKSAAPARRPLDCRVRQRFSESGMNEWQQEWIPTERDNRLHELATRYHTECEAYDQTVCTGPMGQDGILPANPHEMALINRNAHAVLKRLTEEAAREGIGREDLLRAIRKWHGSLPNVK